MIELIACQERLMCQWQVARYMFESLLLQVCV